MTLKKDQMTKKILTILCFSSLLMTNIMAQTPEEKELLQTVEQFRLAMLNADAKQLDKLTSEKLNYWHSSGKHEDKKAFIEALLTGKSDFVTLSFEDINTSFGNELATVHHTLSGDTYDGGVSGSVRIGVLLVFNKEKQQWKLFARQAYKLP